MPAPLPSALRRFGKPRINRTASPVLALATPWLLVILGSLSPTWPVIASAPVLPPFGFLLLVGWQQLRPGLFPVWAGWPLGMVDDLFSGQPIGSAVLLWSVAMIALDFLEHRFPWRGFLLNWLVASAFIGGYLFLALQLANLAGGAASPAVLLPQLAVAVLAYPVAAKLVGLADRFRLIPIRKL